MHTKFQVRTLKKKVMAILQNVLQVASATLKADLSTTLTHSCWKIAPNDGCDGSLELWDGLRTVLVNIVFQEPPQIKIWGVQI